MSEGGNSGLSSVGPFTRLFGACVAASFCTGALALLIGMAVVGVLVSFMLRSEQDFKPTVPGRQSKCPKAQDKREDLL